MRGWGAFYVVCFLICFSSGPPVNVAMAIEVASIDHISEANMVKQEPLDPSVLIFRDLEDIIYCISAGEKKKKNRKCFRILRTDCGFIINANSLCS